MDCPYCGEEAQVVTGVTVYPYRRDLRHLSFYHCEPCDAYCRRESDGRPFGTMANAELRAARIATHKKFDALWKSGQVTRSEAYRWLAKQMGKEPVDTHIRLFSLGDCVAARELVDKHPQSKLAELMS